MKKILAAILILAVVASVFGTDTRRKATRYGTTYVWDRSDTTKIFQGNSNTIYRDSTNSYGMYNTDLLGRDSVHVVIAGFGDADTTQVQITVGECIQGTAFYTIKTDTMVFTGTSVEHKFLSVRQCPRSTYKVAITAYGTTDTSRILSVFVW